MQFTIEHRKAVIGHDITVAVAGENGQLIARVITEYDSSQLGDDQLEPPANQYGRSWTKKGLAGPSPIGSRRIGDRLPGESVIGFEENPQQGSGSC